MNAPHDLRGQQIENFNVLDLLGRGGMGAVYSALDETLLRKVALKVMHGAHRLDADAKARFLREARVLSQLDHPAICTVHNFVEGTEYDVLVMELVDGQNLRKAMKAGLSQTQQLTIASQLLEVLATVHGQGLVHRDLKPENVMVTPSGDIKVLDFGLARSLSEVAEAGDTGQLDPEPPHVQEEDLTIGSARTMPSHSRSGSPTSDELRSRAETLETEVGSIMGTLGYMSPEQARGEPVTAASDMYSVGLILQELFTGKRAIPRGQSPSAVLAQTMLGQSAPVTGIAPELINLVNRLKEVAPGARPSSIDTKLLLEEFLDKPRRIRRRRLVAAAWAIVLLFAAAMAVQSWRVARAAERAEREAWTATRVAKFLEEMFALADPGEAQGSTVTARELLDDGAQRVESELSGEPLLQARLLEVIGQTYINLGLYRQAEPVLASAVHIKELAVGEDDPSLILPLCGLGESLSFAGRYAEAESILTRAHTVAIQALGADHRLTASCRIALASFRITTGDTEGTEALLLSALSVFERTPEDSQEELSQTLHILARLYERESRFEDAERLLLRAIAIDRQIHGPDHPELASSIHNLGYLYLNQGRYDEAEPHLKQSLATFEKVLDPNHTKTAAALHNLANLYLLTGRHDQAEPLLKRSLDISLEVYGPHSGDIFKSYSMLGLLYYRSGDLAAAEEYMRQALEAARRTHGAEHPETAILLNNLGKITSRLGRLGEAETLYLEAVRIHESLSGPDDPQTAFILSNLGELYTRSRRFVEAEERLARAIAILDRSETAGHPHMLTALERYADLLRATGRQEEAAELAARIETARQGSGAS